MRVVIRCGAERKIAYRGQQQPETHENARIAPVGQCPHQKLANTIADGGRGHDIAKHRVVVAQRGFHVAGNDANIVSHEIVCRVSDKCRFKNLPAEFRI